MAAKGICIRVGAFGDGVKGKVADGYDVVGVGRSDAAGTESRTVVSEIAGVGLRSQREILMVAGWMLRIRSFKKDTRVRHT